MEKVDLYRLMATPIVKVNSRAELPDCPDERVHPAPSSMWTRFTESVETIDEDRGGVLLGCVTP